MRCSHCGKDDEEGNVRCTRCGEVLAGLDVHGAGGPLEPGDPRRLPSIPSYLALAIVVTIFCFPPLGLIAILFASRVPGRIERGDYPGARSASHTARLFSVVALGLALMSWLGVFFWMLLGGGDPIR